METPETAANASSIRKVVLASFIGTAIEWYDFFLYGTAAALLFDKIFFSNMDSTKGGFASFATFAVGFVARPIGGVIFGHFGDRLGRKSTLVVSLALMGVSTFLIGLLPTYEQVGILAPVLLVVLRCIQGIGVGGEWGGAVLLAVEHGDRRHRGFNSSWVQVGVSVGNLLALAAFALVSLMPESSLLTWGWRIPFLAGILLLAVGMFIRLKIYESPQFNKAKQHGGPARAPVLEVIRKYPKNILLATGAKLAENASFYVLGVFALSYCNKQLGLEKSALQWPLVGASACQLITLPLFGALSDRFGRRPIYLLGALGMGLFALPYFWLIDSKQPLNLWIAAIVGLGICHAAMYGPQAAFFSELFGTRVRYSGASLGYQLASVFGGGLAPLVAAWLVTAFPNQSWPIAVYLMLNAAITLVAVYFAAETAGEGAE